MGVAIALTLRPASRADAAAISALLLALLPWILDDPAADECAPFLATLAPAAVEARIAADNYRYVVAEDDSGPCGFAALRDGSHLYHLFVREDRHRQGLAGALWRWLLSEAVAPRLTVNASLRAVPAYRRMGFVPDGGALANHGVPFQPMVFERAGHTPSA